MSKINQAHIPVLNYNQNYIVVKTHIREYLLNPAESEDHPYMMPFSLAEIEYVNTNTVAFRSGLLRFPADIEKEMYATLHISDWESIITNDQIQSILINPTMEGLQRLLDIRSSTEFERVRGMLTKLKNEGEDRISLRVDRIIQARYNELINRQTKTQIVLTPKDNVEQHPKQNVEELTRMLEETQRQLAELVKAKEQDTVVEQQVKHPTASQAAKKTNNTSTRGRPKKQTN